MKLKTRSKEKEAQFIEKLKSFFSDQDKVLSLVPECMDSSMLCPFDSYRKKLTRTQGPALGKLSGSADQFLSAIGETYKVMESESAPIMGVIATAYGNLDYAKRGNTAPMLLRGVQNFDDTTWKMLAFSSLVKTKKVFVYSSGNYYIGSCKGNFPGDEFLADVFKTEKVEDLSTEDGFTLGKNGELFVLNIGNTSKINVFQDSKTNLMRILLRHILVPDVMKFFRISVPYLESIDAEVPLPILTSYLSGQTDAKSFLHTVQETRKKTALSRGIYLIGGYAYADPEEFLKALFDEEEAKKLSSYLKLTGPVALDSKSQRKLLEILWPKFGVQIMKDYFPDVDESKIKAQAGDPIRQIEMLKIKIDQEEASSLITVSPWSAESSMLIDMIKDYLSIGKGETLKKWEKRVGFSSLFNSIYYAFVIALQGGSNQKWRFTSEQMMFGEKIASEIKSILDCTDPSINEKILHMKLYVN